ncbi:MAG: hypothetical protein ACLUVC_04670 [Longibaculum sp.]
MKTNRKDILKIIISLFLVYVGISSIYKNYKLFHPDLKYDSKSVSDIEKQAYELWCEEILNKYEVVKFTPAKDTVFSIYDNSLDSHNTKTISAKIEFIGYNNLEEETTYHCSCTSIVNRDGKIIKNYTLVGEAILPKNFDSNSDTSNKVYKDNSNTGNYSNYDPYIWDTPNERAVSSVKELGFVNDYENVIEFDNKLLDLAFKNSPHINERLNYELICCNENGTVSYEVTNIDNNSVWYVNIDRENRKVFDNSDFELYDASLYE